MIAPGQRVGRITIREHLAAGAMGEVFVGYDETLQRQVALKAVHADLWSPRRMIVALADLRAGRGRDASAEPLYRRALALRQAALGRDHPLVAEVRDRLAALRRRQGSAAAAR